MKPWYDTQANAQRVSFGPINLALKVPSTATAGVMALIEETTAAGDGPPLHIHTQQVETFRILEGRYRFAVGDERFELEPGDVAVVPPGLPHTFRNLETEPARLLFTLTPAQQAEAMFQRLAGLLGDGPPDMERINREMEPYGLVIVGPPLAISEP